MIIEFFKGLGILIGYFILCASAALLLRRFVSVPKEVFRKVLHTILLFSLFAWLYAFSTWWVSVLAVLTFVAIVFPLLSLAERFEGYSELLTERKRGEVKRSLVTVFLMFAAIISICWGYIGQKWLVFACVFAWGFGDSAAALVGKKFGKHILQGKLIEGNKSLEGTAAMFVVSLLTVLLIMFLRGNGAWYDHVLIAFLAAVASAVVELYTLNGMDTITCPFAAAAVILPLVYVLGV